MVVPVLEDIRFLCSGIWHLVGRIGLWRASHDTHAYRMVMNLQPTENSRFNGYSLDWRGTLLPLEQNFSHLTLAPLKVPVFEVFVKNLHLVLHCIVKALRKAKSAKYDRFRENKSFLRLYKGVWTLLITYITERKDSFLQLVSQHPPPLLSGQLSAVNFPRRPSTLLSNELPTKG
jgi:hypothetical protein